MTVGTPSDGGFSVPTQFFQQWLDSSIEDEIVRDSRADIRPMTSDTAVAPGWDDGDRSSTLYGGFSGEWLQEAGDMTPQQGKLRLITLKARKLDVLHARVERIDCRWRELRAAAGTGHHSPALGWFLDSAFLSGNGASKPRQASSNDGRDDYREQKENESRDGRTILYANIAKMFGRL